MLKPHGPIRVAVLCSRRAPGLMYLLNTSPDRGATYQIVCCVTSDRTFDEEVRIAGRSIPVRVHPIREFYDARRAAIPHDRQVRAAYDARTLTLIEPYFPDIVLLDGYRYLVTTPLLKTFASRILNLHFSDLTLRRADGRPRFAGIRAVRDSLAAGCTETRATVHLVNEEPDDGPPIVRSWPFPVAPVVDDERTLKPGDAFRARVRAHEEWMMRAASGPLIVAALRLVAAGIVDLDALGRLDGAPHTPWLLDSRGFLMAPEVDLAEVASSHVTYSHHACRGRRPDHDRSAGTIQLDGRSHGAGLPAGGTAPRTG